MKLRLATLTGRNVVPLLPDLARLCTVVFRDWPHLYDGMGVMTLIICRLSPPVRDHSRGLAAIHKAGGITMVLTPAAPPEKGMPENAISYDGPIDLIGNPHCLAEGICAACATQKSLISHRS